MDNLAEQLAKQGVKIVRIGNPARVAEQVLPHTIDVIFLKQFKIVKDIEAKIRNITIKMEGKTLIAYNKEMKTVRTKLNIEKRKLNKQITAQLANAHVVLGTLTCSGTRGPL